MRGAVLPVLAVGLIVPFVAGCLDDEDYAADGHYVYFSWHKSQRTCTNGNCQYGSNADTFAEVLRCSSNPTLSWDSRLEHGSVFVQVRDDDGAYAANRTVSGTSKGNATVPGEPGEWTFTGTTRNANGNLEIRLTCD